MTEPATTSFGGAGQDRNSVLGKAVLLGIVAGLLSGLFGIGGGIIIVPGLVLLLGMDERLAHGTSLAAVIPIAAAGVIGFAISDSIDWPAALCLVAGSSVGAVIGAQLLNVVPRRVLSMAFAALLVATAVRLLLSVPDATGRGELDAGVIVGLVGLGLVTGVLSGLLGVGGGIVMVPGQVILFSIDDAIAKGTSLAVIIPTGIVATWRNISNGNADIGIATAVGLAGTVAAFGMSQLSVRLDAGLSLLLFGVLLLLIAARMIVQLWRTR